MNLSRRANVAKRILKTVSYSVLILFLVLVLNFVLIRLMPGDVLIGILGESEYTRLMTEFPEQFDVIREKYGLNDSYLVQFGKYLNNILHFNFGYSYSNTQPVTEYVMYNMMWTLILMLPTLIMSSVFGGILGLVAGQNPKSLFNKVMTGIAIIIGKIPAQFISILLLMLFAFHLQWFPLGGMTSGGLSGTEKAIDVIYHMTLPVLILTTFRTLSNFLYVKSYTMQLLQEDYMITAMSKGLRKKSLINRHLLKNIMLPYSTQLCMQFGGIFGGSMVLETVFSWKGMGVVMNTAAQTKDFPVLQFAILLIAATVLLSNIIADIIAGLIDPRIGSGVENE